MKHDYGNVAQIGNALYFMASKSKSPILATLIPYFKFVMKPVVLKNKHNKGCVCSGRARS